MKVLSSLICQTSIQDEATKNVSLINVIDQLNVSLDDNTRFEDGLLRLPFFFELVTHLHGEDIKGKKYQIVIETRDPEDRVLNSNTHVVLVPSDKKRFRLTMKVAGITLSKSGTYAMRLILTESGSKSESFIIDTPLDVNIDVKK